MSDIETQIQQDIDDTFGQGRLSASQEALIADIVRHTLVIPIEEQQLDFAQWQKYVEDYYQTHLLPTFEQSPNDADIQLAVGFFYQLVGELAEIAFNQAQKQIDYCQTGIALLTKCEVSAAVVRTTILTLYVNTGITQGQLGNLQDKLKSCQSGLDYAKAFLHQETNSEVRAHILLLYRHAGVTQFQLGNLQQALQSLQSGLDYAQHCLQSGERNNAVWEQILTLHSNYGATWEQLQQNSQQIFNLAPLGFWTWTMAGKVEENWFTIMKNWAEYLRPGVSEPIFLNGILNGIQNLLTNIIQTWHQPEKSHRLFASIPTETLLSIAESLYLLEQAKTKQFFTDSYQKLDKLHDNEAVFHLRKNLEKYHGLNKFCTPNWFNFLKCWWQKQQAERTRAKISELDKATMQNIQELINKIQEKLQKWLNNLIQQQTQPDELYDLSSILLGILFICQKDDFEKTLEQWRHKPIWHDDLQQALAATHWQQWLENSDKIALYVWSRILYERVDTNKRIRLKIDNGKDDRSQPELVNWLKGKIPKDKTQLPELLDAAWQNAQKQAKPLGYIFAILNNTDFDGNFSQQIEDDEAQQQALIATLLGDGQQQLESKIKYWLTQQTDSQQELGTLQQLADIQYRFQRLVDIHNIPKQIPYADKTYQWAMVLLHETLATSEITDYGAGVDYMTIKAAKIWSLLERSRIALQTNKLILPENWEQILAQDLWNNLGICIKQVLDGHITQDNELFPVIPTWLDTINQWQHKRDTNYKICQQKLESNQAIMQPFIDQSRGIVRVLWLDKKQLTIYDFSNPEHAANWQTLIDQWQQQKNWNTVLDSDILNSFANDIKNWAKDIQHIIAIYQPPLGQLAWEAMPQLANKLSREISIDHWLHCPKPQQAQKWVLGVTDFEKTAQDGDKAQISKYARFIPHETLLVANYWETEAQLIDKQPELNLFQALKKLREHQHIYISTHGVYNKKSPLQSGLSLCNNQEKTNAIDLPLWICTTLHLDDSELMILSACETATNTSQQNLFDPLSIASVFAASGVNTVIATLSQIKDIASLTFINELLNLAKEQPQTPWHQLIKQTREKFQNLTNEDMQQLSQKLDTITENKELIGFPTELKNEYNIFLQPKSAEHWANFIVIGDVRRN